MFDFLKGKKTYLQAAAGAIIFALYTLGVLDVETAATIGGFLGIGALASLRAAVKKVE